MKITRKHRPGATIAEQTDSHTSSPLPIVCLGTISELVQGGGSVHADGNEMSLFGY